jgi:hypothetical protein
MAGYPINAMSVVTGSGKLAPVAAVPVVVITNGSVPIGPGCAQPVVEVAAGYPRAPVAPIPVVYATGTPPVAPVDPIPVFVTGTVLTQEAEKSSPPVEKPRQRAK